jgi:hypothetical protein
LANSGWPAHRLKTAFHVMTSPYFRLRPYLLTQ